MKFNEKDNKEAGLAQSCKDCNLEKSQNIKYGLNLATLVDQRRLVVTFKVHGRLLVTISFIIVWERKVYSDLWFKTQLKFILHI